MPQIPTTREELESRVTNILVEQLGIDPEQVKPESTFTDLGADSLDTVELIMAFEEELEIEIHDDEAENIKTVADAVNYLCGKLDIK